MNRIIRAYLSAWEGAREMNTLCMVCYGNPCVCEDQKVKFIEGTQFINVYETNKAYGGPEEGGWWYCTGEIISSEQVMSDAVEAKKAEKQSWCDENNVGRYRPGSVLCTGWYCVRVEDEPGANYPETTPHYE